MDHVITNFNIRRNNKNNTSEFDYQNTSRDEYLTTHEQTLLMMPGPSKAPLQGNWPNLNKTVLSSANQRTPDYDNQHIKALNLTGIHPQTGAHNSKMQVNDISKSLGNVESLM